MQTRITRVVAPPIGPDEPSHKEQSDSVENGFVGAIKVAYQDFASIMAKEWNREVFFDGNHVGADEESQKAKKNQGMHHARMTILEDLFLSEGLEHQFACPRAECIEARIGTTLAPGGNITEHAIKQDNHRR